MNLLREISLYSADKLLLLLSQFICSQAKTSKSNSLRYLQCLLQTTEDIFVKRKAIETKFAG